MHKAVSTTVPFRNTIVFILRTYLYTMYDDKCFIEYIFTKDHTILILHR